MNKKTQIHALTFVMLFATYGIALGLDRLDCFVRQPNTIVNGVESILWIRSLAYTIIAFCVFLLYKKSFHVLKSLVLWIIVITGLLISFIPMIYWLLIPDTRFLGTLMSGRDYFIGTGGFIAVAALFTLYKMKKATA